MRVRGNIKTLGLPVLLFLALLAIPTNGPGSERKGLRLVQVPNPAEKIVPERGDSYALVIGVSEYTQGWQKLGGVHEELDQVVSILLAYGFQVTRVNNPNSKQMYGAFKNFKDRYGLEPNNRLLFFFSGHGHSWRGDTRGYLVPADAPNPRRDKKGFLSKAMSMNQILTWCREMEARHVLFLFDSCFSGTIFKSKGLEDDPPHISRMRSMPVRQFITAGSAGERVPARSVFTPLFVRALRGEGDISRDGYITGTELGLFLQEKVPYYSLSQTGTVQTPQCGKIRDPELDEGDFVFDLASLDAGRKEPKPEQPTASVSPTALPERPVQIWKEPITGMEFVWVYGGCYPMGSPEREPDRDADEGPLHDVCIDGFWMGRYEVTHAQFRQFDPDHKSPDYRGHSLEEDPQPVVYVNWHEAKAFSAWLTAENGNKFVFRLPVEAEWEYACRAGTTTARFWGDAPDQACRFANVHDETARDEIQFSWSCHPCIDGYPVVSPVGSFRGNGLGLFDMLGNVWEWCEDVYTKDAYRKHGKTNPVVTEGGSSRVFRGGSWDYGPGSVRCANRNEGSPDRRSSNLGFRLVMKK